jgi:hypothetical protein
VLQKGMTWKEIGIKNTDLQFVELRKLKGYDIAAMNRMPPHKVGLMDRATFTNIEHQGIEYATDTVHPHCVNWEQELSAQLLRDDEQDGLYFKFNMNALQRGDAKTRGDFYGRMFGTGALSPNGIREYEDENPVEGGDRYFVPVNMVPMDRVDDVVDRGGNRDSAPGGGGTNDKGTARATRAAQLEQAAAERVVRKEAAALKKIAPGEGHLARVEEFYRDHIAFVEEVMQVDAATAMAYCERRVQFVSDAAALQMGGDDFRMAFEQQGPAELLSFIREQT